MARCSLLVALLAAGAAIGVCLYAAPASAASLAFDCEELDAGKASKMSIVYDGEASGTLKVIGSVGEMSLSATMEKTEIEVEGQKVMQTGIRAFGTAKTVMPGKAALEACITGKRQPDETDDILGLMACRTTVEPAQAEAKVSLELSFQGETGDPFVYVKRTYLEESSDYLSGNGKKGGFISIESVPPPSCKRVVSP
ncbi:MAG: hypothetical protein U1E49_11940 [Hyphomicrobiaceae bacterium]